MSPEQIENLLRVDDEYQHPVTQFPKQLMKLDVGHLLSADNAVALNAVSPEMQACIFIMQKEILERLNAMDRASGEKLDGHENRGGDDGLERPESNPSDHAGGRQAESESSSS